MELVMAKTKKPDVKKLNADIVVVGGGNGGMVAAVRSAECGAKVVLLEKTDSLGGASVMALGITSVNSRVQVAAGNSEKLAEELFSKMMTETRWVPDPDVVRRFVHTTGVFADWVNTKKPGFLKIFPDQKRTEWSGGLGFSILISKYCKEENGIDVYMETRATKLLADKKGTVVGVLAKSKDTEYEIHTKGVILSAGGFSRDRKMLKKYFPQYFDNDLEFEFEGGPALARFADGDGIKMAQGIGSMTDYHMDVLVETAHHGSEHTRHIYARPDLIYVNKNGKRFMTETARDGAARRWISQPDAIIYAVFDSDTLDYFLRDFSSLSGRFEGTQMPERQIEKWKQARERLEDENRAGNTKIADTLDEIAKYIGADPAVFETEVKRYNTFCDKGRDEDYYKDPKYLHPIRKAPFYALRCNVFWQHTRGGIVINKNTEVLSRKGTVIKGLYATGDNASGWLSEYGYVGGTGFTWSLVSAYMAAESSCKYVKSLR
jgi:fumarate reductase flavoprotein subunit